MDYLEMIEKKEGEFSALYSRMDTDQELYYLKEFTMKDFEGKAIPKVYNITLNDPITYANVVISTLLGSQKNIIIKSDRMKDEEKKYIKDFLKDIEESANELITQKDKRITDLWSFNTHHICLRGHLAARCLIGFNGDWFLPDITPWDARYVTYEAGRNGLLWAANKITRSKSKIQSEYNIDIKGDEGEVIDFWDEEFNHVFIERELIREQKHNLGYVPVVIQVCPSGSMLLDSSSWEHSGESIYFANRGLYGKLNAIASIDFTVTHFGFKPNLQYESQAGTDATPPPVPPYGVGVVVPVEPGLGFKKMPLEDVHNAARQSFAIIEARIQRGGLPATSYGNLTFPLSAVALARLGATEDQLYAPRFQGLALFYKALWGMVIKQYTDRKLRVKLEGKGNKKKYSGSQLKGDYEIEYQFSPVAPERNIADLSVAAAQQNFLSVETILRDTLKVDNPTEEYNKKLVDLAMQINSTVAKIRIIKALVDEGQDYEAKVMAAEMGMSLDQILSGGQAGKEKGVTPLSVKPILPLMGGQASSIKRSQKGAEALESEAPIEEE